MPGTVLGAQLAHAPRVIVETDLGGDPDDEQSMVRFLLYASEFDIEGIIANRPTARPGENKNRERTGLGIARALLNAYGQCWTNLVRHDSRFPPREFLWTRTVAGYDNTDDGVELILRAVDAEDPRPIWFMNWGTDNGAAESCLKRALDRVRRERSPEGYARFKKCLRLASADKFGEHTTTFEPPFPIWVDTFRPELQRLRWYHRFSALTSKAGGFDVLRDVLTGHGPLGALYPTNTTHWCKEGDTMTFLSLLPVGMNDPEQPTWGSWAGRYGSNENFPNRPYFWANQSDAWNGITNRDNTLARWAADLQNDFRARLDWCVQPYDRANHPPVVRVSGERFRTIKAGQSISLDASQSSDPDGQLLRLSWWHYSEPSTVQASVDVQNGESAGVRFLAPRVSRPETLHFVVTARDNGTPPLARYGRVVITVVP